MSNRTPLVPIRRLCGPTSPAHLESFLLCFYYSLITMPLRAFEESHHFHQNVFASSWPPQLVKYVASIMESARVSIDKLICYVAIPHIIRIIRIISCNIPDTCSHISEHLFPAPHLKTFPICFFPLFLKQLAFTAIWRPVIRSLKKSSIRAWLSPCLSGKPSTCLLVLPAWANGGHHLKRVVLYSKVMMDL